MNGRARNVMLLAVPMLLTLAAAGAGPRAPRPEEARAAKTPNPRTGRVFVMSGADGTLLRTIDAPDPDRSALFGNAVVGLGDVDGDLVPDLAVGAPGVSIAGASRAGRVYIFSGANGSLIRSIPSPASGKGGRFGFSLADAGDLDGDGIDDVVVGAPRALDPGGRGRTGVAYVVSGADGSIVYTLLSDVPQRGAVFGWSVAAGADLTSDGIGEILVGAPGENVRNRSNEGRVYLFNGDSTLIRPIGDPNRQQNAEFGISVAFLPDATSDAIPDILVGADGQDYFHGDFAGRVFVLSGADPNAPAVSRAAPIVQPGANFGFAVAGLPDVNGDGLGDIAATAPETSVTYSLSGIAFVMGGDPNSPTLATLSDPQPDRLGFLGGSMAALPDLTGDALPEIAVGAELHRDPNGVRAGRTYVFQAASGAPYLTIESPTGDACARFGWIVSPIGDVNGDNVPDVIVGAPFHHVTTVYAPISCF
jgi:FG-GAP repeat protein